MSLASDLQQGPPTAHDLLRARRVVSRDHPRTGLFRSDPWSSETGCEVYVKYENHTPIRSFKARGALYRLSLLDDAERIRGVVSASTGNFGQGIAFAGTAIGVRTLTVVPRGTPELKTAAIASFGGELVVDGAHYGEACEIAHRLAASDGMVYLEEGEDAGLMAGAGTVAWEILEDLPDVDAIIVPVGGGNLIAGVALVAKLVRPEVRVIGVQSEAAQAVYMSLQEGRVVEAACETFADGLATTRPGHLAFPVLRSHVAEMLIVSEDALRRHIVRALEMVAQVVEGAGAAPFVALERLAPKLQGKRVALILTGGNFALPDLVRTIERYG